MNRSNIVRLLHLNLCSEFFKDFLIHPSVLSWSVDLFSLSTILYPLLQGTFCDEPTVFTNSYETT